MDPNIGVVMVCKYCSLPISREDFFCPHCGKKLKEKPVSLGIWSLLWLLILSTLVPPFGIGLTIRYIRAEDKRARTIGWISLIITIVALVATVWISIGLMDSINQQVNSAMQNYQF